MPRRCANTPGRGRDLLGGPDIAKPTRHLRDVSVSAAHLRIRAALHDLRLAPNSTDRLADLMERFSSYVGSGCHLQSLEQVTAGHVEDFVFAKGVVRGETIVPSPATMHLRCSAVRLYFRLARSLGLYDGDPTLDLVLPQRSPKALRPLTDDEVALCRSCSFRSIMDTFGPAAWALAEMGARTSEIPRILLADIHSGSRRVWLHGSNKARPRWGELTSWGVEQVRRRAAVVRRQELENLVYRGMGDRHSRQAAACIAVSETLRRAGLHTEPDIRPGSVVAWAGLQVFQETGCIGETARALGMRSLDSAARMIGWEWAAAAHSADDE